MGNTKTGTLGKLSRRVRRNTERAMKARGKREKLMMHEWFKKAFNLGADMAKIHILNATAGYEYEADQTPVQVADVVNVDDSSESTLGSDLMAEDTCPSPEVYGPKLPA
jgi:hypothetical protein